MASKIICFLAFLLTVSTAYGLTCYKCDSSESKFCNYGLTSFTYPTVDCSEGGNFLTNIVPKDCVKIIAKDAQGAEYVARGCMPNVGGACDAVVKTLGFFSSLDGPKTDLNCYTCDTDNCNSSNQLTGFALFGVVLAIFTFLF